MPLRTSNPSSYDKIFTIRSGATATIAENTQIPNHRALLINCTSAGDLAVTNLDDTTSTVTFAVGTILLPLQIKKYAVSTGTFNIYGLI